MTVINLLDHGSVELDDHMGSDLKIVRMARQSYDAAWRAGLNEKSDAKLINYLYSNGHNTPFEHCCFTFNIQAPIFVFRQWHRHRTQSYSEQSARYTVMPEICYVVNPKLIGVQSAGNKQCRDIDDGTPATLEQVAISQYIRESNGMCFERYRALLDMGTPRELARGVLDFNTYSKMSATMNLWNLFGFLRERLHEHAQYEIRVYAEAMLEMIRPIVPVAVEAFENGR